MEKVTLTEEELFQAEFLAEATYQKFKEFGGHYTNSKRSHLRGKIGEIAAARWLTDHGLTIDGPYTDMARISACDIVVEPPGVRIEVKTWGAEYWEEMGRCVAVGQLRKICAKADIVLWGTTHANTVVLQGWTPVAEIEKWPIRMTGPATGRKVENHQADNSDLRPMAELVHFIAGRDVVI